MLAITETELAAIYPLVRRLGPVVIFTAVSLSFLMTALAILALGGTLSLALAVLVAEVTGAGILLAGIYAWCVLEDSAERAHREITASAPAQSASVRCPRTAA